MNQLPNVDLLEYEEVTAEHSSAVTVRTWYHYVLLVAAAVFAVVSVGFVGTILWSSFPDWLHNGGTLLTGRGWTSPSGPFGGLAMIVGTLETSLIALVIAVLIGLGTSVTIVFFIPGRLKTLVATLEERRFPVLSMASGAFWYSRRGCRSR
jgi:phosphate transport system permease protein